MNSIGPSLAVTAVGFISHAAVNTVLVAAAIWTLYALLPRTLFNRVNALPPGPRCAIHFALLGALLPIYGSIVMWRVLSDLPDGSVLAGPYLGFMSIPSAAVQGAVLWAIVGFAAAPELEKRRFRLDPSEAIAFAGLGVLFTQVFGGFVLYAVSTAMPGIDAAPPLFPTEPVFWIWIVPSFLSLLALCAVHRWAIRLTLAGTPGHDLAPSRSSGRPGLRAEVAISGWLTSLAGLALVLLVLFAAAMKSAPILKEADALLALPLPVVALILCGFGAASALKHRSPRVVTMIYGPPIAAGLLALLVLAAAFFHQPG